jgi:NADH:ubiquinone oxidoreductase subunit F (NADH-binding)
MSLPRLLAGVRRDVALSLPEHESVHGPAPQASPDLIEAVAQSGLRGRGGASFPTAVKMSGVARHRGPRSVLVNAAESEPMSAKDRALLHMNPHLVLDGAVAAADAVGARSITIAIPEDAVTTRSALRRALSERSPRQRLNIAAVPVAHLSGQESALIRYLNGGPLKPTIVPPLPVERGLKRRPTLVQNAETLAHLALINRHGPDWFRALGTSAHTGSALVTVSGAVQNQGVYEIACGTALASVLEAAGGTLEPLSAVLVGGYHGVWVSAQEIDSVTLDDARLSRHGGNLGAGVLVALGRSACPVRELAGTVDWLASESAGQCGPCSNGLPALADLLAAMAAGHAPDDAWQRLERWTGDLPGRGACHLPDGAVRFLRSGMRVFGTALAEHQHGGPCQSCRRIPTLSFGLAGGLAARAAV